MRSPQGFSACRSRPAAPLRTGTAGPSCGCTPTKARPKAQTGRNKAEKKSRRTFGGSCCIKVYARAHEKIQKGAEEIKRAHSSSLHSVPLAPLCISKPTPRTFQVHTKQNQRIISCFPAWDRMREDWKQKRKQAPEPDGGGACVWILNLSLCSSVNALYHSNIEKNISQYVTINCNFYKCTFKLKALDNTARLNVCYM